MNIAVSILHCTIGSSCLFVAYFFWTTTNGELRKIFIRKNVSLALMFFSFAIIVLFKNPTRLYFAFVASLPFLFYVFKLIIYFRKSKN